VEHIKEALSKSKLRESDKPAPRKVPTGSGALRISPLPSPKKQDSEAWAPRKVSLDPAHLERMRIVSYGTTDPNHIAFNLLRTRVRKQVDDNGWHKIAITSPTAGCGKTMVAINLAFSLARSPDAKIVLVDLDLKKPAVAKTLGIEPTGSISRYLQGSGTPHGCFVEVDPNLIIGLNFEQIRQSSELLQSSRMADLIDFIEAEFSPTLIVFDLPPMLSCDDALVFLPRVDSSLLVVAAGTTKVPEIDECETQISNLDKFMGVVMNKTEDTPKEYYY